MKRLFIFSCLFVFVVLHSGKAFAQWVCDPFYQNVTEIDSAYTTYSATGCFIRDADDAWTGLGGHPNLHFGQNVSLYNPVTARTCLMSTQNNPTAGFTCAVDTAPAAGTIWEVRVRDGNGAALSDVVTSDGAAIAATLNALTVANLTYGAVPGAPLTWTAVLAVPPAAGQTPGSSLNVKNWNMIYNGATWDPMLSGAVGEVQMTDVATRPGEDAANDWRKIKKSAIQTYSPAKENTANIGTSAVTVLASKEVLGYVNCCVYYRNNDAVDPLTDSDICTSPDNAGTCGDGNWFCGNTTCNAVVHGATCAYCFANNANRYICVTAAAADANPVSSLDMWITCNVD